MEIQRQKRNYSAIFDMFSLIKHTFSAVSNCRLIEYFIEIEGVFAYGGIYRTRRKLDDGIPFYAEGEAWQSTKHIYAWPFWFIDCALSQIVALQFWAMMREDFENAWKHYMAYTMQGGSRTFLDLLKYADLQSPLTRIV